eukprot:39771-Eustigmatos_ZCMA.PRE.1
MQIAMPLVYPLRVAVHITAYAPMGFSDDQPHQVSPLLDVHIATAVCGVTRRDRGRGHPSTRSPER